MGKVLGIMMNKGGVGKTSLATNLAALATLEGKKTLIIDTDGQGNAALAFGLIPNDFAYTVADVFTGQMDFDGVITDLSRDKFGFLNPGLGNLDLAPANDDMNMLDFEILTKLDRYPNPFRLLVDAVAGIRDRYDLIFIDTPPAMGLVAGNVLSVADEIIVPFVPESFGVSGFIRIVEALAEFEEAQGIRVTIGGVAGMMFDSRTTLHHQMMEEAARYCAKKGIRLFKTVIPRSIRFPNATAYEKKPAVLVDRSNPLVNAYSALLLEVLSRD